MPFERPTLQTLCARACADIESRIKTGTATFILFVRRQLLGILGRMQGGLAHGLYGYLDWLALQLMPDTAEEEHLERWASIWGIFRKPATSAEGTVRLEGARDSLIPAGTEVQRRDGLRYAVIADALIGQHVPGEALVAVCAQEPGAAGNAPAGTDMQLASPVPGINAQGRAYTNIAGGADAEHDSALRARLLFRLRQPPRGGAAHDYVRWALEVPGVTRAWCYPLEMGPGTVTVRFVMDDAPNGIPTDEDAARVKAHIDDLRPATAEVHVFAPVAVPVNLDLRVDPDTPRVRAKTEESVWRALRRDAVPGGTVLLSHIRGAVGNAEGVEDYTLLAPLANIILGPGEMPVPGVIDWGDPAPPPEEEPEEEDA